MNVFLSTLVVALIAVCNGSGDPKEKLVDKRSLNHEDLGTYIYTHGPSPLQHNTHTHTHSVQTITKQVGVPQPYPVHITKQVGVPVPQPYPVHVPKPYAVPVEVKVPVEVPRPYPVTVTQRVPYPVEKPVYITNTVKVPVPQPYPVPHPVEVKVPTPVFIKENNHGWANNYGHDVGSVRSFSGLSGTYTGTYVPSSLGGLYGHPKSYNTGWQKSW